MLKVCVGSTDRDLTTTSAFKALLNTTSTASDALYSTLIRAASKWAENVIGYPPTVQSYQESVAGYGRREIMLGRSPLRAVPRLFQTTDTGTGTQVLTSEFRVDNDEAGTIARDEGFEWEPTFAGRWFDSALPLSATPLPGQEQKQWLTDYVAGWTYGGIDTGSANWSTVQGSTSTGRTLPEDIELAVLFRTRELLNNGTEVASESLGDLSVNYRSLGTDKDGKQLTASRQLLEPYRRFA